VQPGDVLLNITGASIGRCCVVPDHVEQANVNQHVCIIRPTRDVLPDYLQHVLELPQTQNRIRVMAAGGRGVNFQQVAALSIPWVPIPQQREMGEVRQQFAAALEALRKQIDAKGRFRRGLMQEMLTGMTRFKKYEGEPWTEVHLGDVFEERVETARTDLPLLSITGDRGVIPRDELERRDTSNADKSKYLRIAPGDIGYNTMRMWQGVSALSELEGIVSPAYTICVPTQRIDGAFAARLLKVPAVVGLFRRYSQGLVDDTLSLKYNDLAKIRVRLPGVTEQRAIAAFLTAVDRELRLLERLRDALERQRRGVMELLLTGKVRVPA
jgi:type I restriction enzyme S subunit